MCKAGISELSLAELCFFHFVVISLQINYNIYQFLTKIDGKKEVKKIYIWLLFPMQPSEPPQPPPLPNLGADGYGFRFNFFIKVGSDYVIGIRIQRDDDSGSIVTAIYLVLIPGLLGVVPQEQRGGKYPENCGIEMMHYSQISYDRNVPDDRGCIVQYCFRTTLPGKSLRMFSHPTLPMVFVLLTADTIYFFEIVTSHSNPRGKIELLCQIEAEEIGARKSGLVSCEMTADGAQLGIHHTGGVIFLEMTRSFGRMTHRILT